MNNDQDLEIGFSASIVDHLEIQTMSCQNIYLMMVLDHINSDNVIAFRNRFKQISLAEFFINL